MEVKQGFSQWSQSTHPWKMTHKPLYPLIQNYPFLPYMVLHRRILHREYFDICAETKQQLPPIRIQEHQMGEIMCYDRFTNDLNTITPNCVLLTRGEKSSLTHGVDRTPHFEGETQSWWAEELTVVQVTFVTNKLLKCFTLQWLRPGPRFYVCPNNSCAVNCVLMI